MLIYYCAYELIWTCLLCKTGLKRPLDTPKRMIERRESERKKIERKIEYNPRKSPKRRNKA